MEAAIDHLQSRVLVLDVGLQPVQIVSWKTAIVWVLDRVVAVTEEYPDRYIRTPSWKVNMPSVVQFLRPIPRKRAVKFSRRNIFLRDKGQCQYCGRRVGRDDWEMEHVIPRAQGGTTKYENVVVSCTKCNQRKAGRTPAQAGMHLIAHPVKPKWLPDVMSAGISYREDMPESWKDRLTSAVYWDGALDEDK